MNEITGCLAQIFQEHPLKIILSNPRQGDFQKIVLEKRSDGYSAEKFTDKQAFHEKIAVAQLPDYCAGQLACFRQLNAWTAQVEYQIRISKKGKVLLGKNRLQESPKIREEHNRKKTYLLEEGQVIEPLVDMGIFSKEGQVIHSMYDKYRQINRFLELVDDAVKRTGLKKLRIIDFGCGKSYLTFVLYYYLTFVRGLEADITGLDLKADVIEKCRLAAQKYGYTRLHFKVGDINGYQADGPVDLVISLHACDTATDYALFNAVCWEAKIILSVPCCQHELCEQLNSSELTLFQRYGIVKERSAALITDAIRANLLEACGYKTQLLEFVDLEHTPKNILIRAVRSRISPEHRRKMLDEVERLNACFQLHPTLLRLLEENGRLI